MRNPKILYAIPAPLPFQTPGEEIANSVLHGLGVPVAIAGLTLLLLRANGYLGGTVGGALALVSYSLFGFSMIVMFLASTLYHAIQHERAKRVFRILDHSAIYFLIAGTYTPFSLLGFRGALGWVYFGIEWGLAATGIALYAANCKFIKKAELIVYLFMGWAVVVGLYRLYRGIPLISIIFLVAGGIAYSLGTIWYGRHNRRISHVIWHVFVLAGAVCHWFSIWYMS
ncbi:hemolysin III [Spirochaetia bacterium]|nr:hemolysin III [Spirochaetia bacterium]GHV90647.1 hemolysin III [Spirochaetia bacterium]